MEIIIHVYCGEGKGKTTAAMGLILRALGHERKVLLVQLMKNHATGELEILKNLPNITILRGKSGEGFSFSMTEAQKAKTSEISNGNLKKALEILQNKACDMLVIDEACGALNRGLADEKLIREIIEQRDNAEIVFTGRKPPQFLIDAADYVTEMTKIKHPFEQGISAREGIEF